MRWILSVACSFSQQIALILVHQDLGEWNALSSHLLRVEGDKSLAAKQRWCQVLIFFISARQEIFLALWVGMQEIFPLFALSAFMPDSRSFLKTRMQAEKKHSSCSLPFWGYQFLCSVLEKSEGVLV